MHKCVNARMHEWMHAVMKDSLNEWLADSLNDCMDECMEWNEMQRHDMAWNDMTCKAWMHQRMRACVIERPNGCSAAGRHVFTADLISWMNARTNEWTNEWKREWINVWMTAWIHVWMNWYEINRHEIDWRTTLMHEVTNEYMHEWMHDSFD